MAWSLTNVLRGIPSMLSESVCIGHIVDTELGSDIYLLPFGDLSNLPGNLEGDGTLGCVQMLLNVEIGVLLMRFKVITAMNWYAHCKVALEVCNDMADVAHILSMSIVRHQMSELAIECRHTMVLTPRDITEEEYDSLGDRIHATLAKFVSDSWSLAFMIEDEVGASDSDDLSEDDDFDLQLPQPPFIPVKH